MLIITNMKCKITYKAVDITGIEGVIGGGSCARMIVAGKLTAKISKVFKKPILKIPYIINNPVKINALIPPNL